MPGGCRQKKDISAFKISFAILSSNDEIPAGGLMMYLPATGICICFRKNACPGLTQKSVSLHPSDPMISTVIVLRWNTVGEKDYHISFLILSGECGQQFCALFQ